MVGINSNLIVNQCCGLHLFYCRLKREWIIFKNDAWVSRNSPPAYDQVLVTPSYELTIIFIYYFVRRPQKNILLATIDLSQDGVLPTIHA